MKTFSVRITFTGDPPCNVHDMNAKKQHGQYSHNHKRTKYGKMGKDYSYKN